MILLKVAAFFVVSFVSGATTLLLFRYLLRRIDRLRVRLSERRTGRDRVLRSRGDVARSGKGQRQWPYSRTRGLQFPSLGRRPAPGQIEAIRNQDPHLETP